MVVAVAAVLLSTHVPSAVTLFEDCNHHNNHSHQHHQLSSSHLAEPWEDLSCAFLIAGRADGSSPYLATRAQLLPPHQSSSIELSQYYYHHHHHHQQQHQRVAHPAGSPRVAGGGVRIFSQANGSLSAAVVPSVVGEVSSRRFSSGSSNFAVSATGSARPAGSPVFSAGLWGAATTACGGSSSTNCCSTAAQCASSKDGGGGTTNNTNSARGASGRRGRDVLAKVSSTTAFRSWESENYSSSDSPTQSPPRPAFPSYVSPNTSDRADDVNLHNPLRRLERLGCGWLGLIVEWEGVVVEDNPAMEAKAWEALAEEEGRSMPMAFMLRRAEGMKNEQVLSQVLCWARDPREVRRLARRKEELYEEMLTVRRRMNVVLPGVLEFICSAKKHGAPVALVSTRPRAFVETALKRARIQPGMFEVIVAAEDVERGKPDPEMYLYASQVLRMIPERLIVVGNAHSSIEAAHDAGMKCVAVVGRHAAYELHEAEAVVRRLSDLSFQHLKSLVSQEPRDGLNGFVTGEPEPEMEEQTEQQLPRVSFADW